MPAELVSLSIDAVDYGGWLTCEVTRSLESVSGSFSVAITERWPGMTTTRPIRCGSRCVVRVGGDTLITGYVDDIRPSYSALDHSVVISGRDTASDLVDCSAESKEWHNQQVERIVADIAAPFGIRITSAVAEPLGAVWKFRTQEGETAWSAIERICRMRAVICTSDGLGNLKLTRAATEPAVSIIRGGQDGTILDANASHSHRDRFSHYVVKGQRRGEDNATPETSAHGLAVTQDLAVGRYRPKILIAEDQGDSGSLRDRANWECAVARGRSQSASIQVHGWRDANKVIWSPNRRVRVHCDWLRLQDEMLVSSVRLRQSEDGTLTDLDLVHPDTFSPQPGTREDIGWGSERRRRFNLGNLSTEPIL